MPFFALCPLHPSKARRNPAGSWLNVGQIGLERPCYTNEVDDWPKVSRSETWVPKRGGLKAAGKRQESATFLQRSFFDFAVQFFVCCTAAFGPNDFRIAEKTMLQCSSCSAALRKLQCNFRFRLWHVAEWGLEGSCLGLADKA